MAGTGFATRAAMAEAMSGSVIMAAAVASPHVSFEAIRRPEWRPVPRYRGADVIYWDAPVVLMMDDPVYNSDEEIIRLVLAQYFETVMQ